MRVLLVGGPFHWRTMNLPDRHKSMDLFLPLPLAAQVMPQPLVDSYSVLADVTTAHYVRGALVYTRPIGLDATPEGVVYEYAGSR